jgi:uncharacterized protein YggE
MKKMAFIVSMLISCAAAVFAQAADTDRTISISGEALIMVVPDEAVVTLGVETFNASLQKGQELNTAAGKRVLDSIKALGVDEKFIKTQDLSVSLQYANNAHPSRGIEGYTLRRMYVVTLKDVSRAAAVVNTALLNGANIVSGIDYRTTELRKHRDAARVAAVRAAREKATALLAELGCRIGQPRTVSEANLGYYGYGRGFQTQNVMTTMEGSEVSGDLTVDTVPAGQIGIRATVQIVFDIVKG